MHNVCALFQAVVFNLLIGNNDAHAKNFSLLHDADGTTTLAPLYDLVSTEVYPRFQGGDMAMRVGGACDFTRLCSRHVIAMAKDMAVPPALTRRLLLAMCAQLPPLAAELAEECGWPVGRRIAAIVAGRAHRLQTLLRQPGDGTASPGDAADEFSMFLEAMRRPDADPEPSSRTCPPGGPDARGPRP